MRRPQLDFNFLIPFGNDYFQFSSAKVQFFFDICKFWSKKVILLTCRLCCRFKIGICLTNRYILRVTIQRRNFTVGNVVLKVV